MISIKSFKPPSGSIKPSRAVKQRNVFSKVITPSDRRDDRESELTSEDVVSYGLHRIHLVHLASSKLISRLTSIADIQRYLSLLFESQIQSLTQVSHLRFYSQ